MNPEIKAKWVAALRSGEYLQGTGQLLNTYSGASKYCCLGVLCDLLVKEDTPGLEYSDRQPYGSSVLPGWTYHGIGETSILPAVLAIDLGLTDPNPRIPFIQAIWDDSRMSVYKESHVEWHGDTYFAPPFLDLASLNDSGFTFPEIADLIERYL